MVSWPSFSASVMRLSKFSMRSIAVHDRSAGGLKRSENQAMPISERIPSGASTEEDAAASPAALAALAEDALLETVQRQTFRYFWEGAHPLSGLAFDRRPVRGAADESRSVAVGGSGFGAMALVVAVERGWIARDAGVERIGRMLELLSRAQ